MNEKPIIVVQGGQYGSEGKGMVAAALCLEHNVDIAVRTGSVNAGHTVYYNGLPYRMQQLPTGWVNPNTIMVIGAGAYIDPDILKREILDIAAATGNSVAVVAERISIDYRCGIHLPQHTDRSTSSGRHHLMGATGKGCSESVIDKIRLRGQKVPILTFADWLERRDSSEDLSWVPELLDTEHNLNAAYDDGNQILIEGTQGTLLDLHLGPYPYTTHKQTTVANWISECGLSPNLEYEIILCLRTYPIRVAGNSGPMPGEILWEALADEINSKGSPVRVEDSALDWWADVQAAVADEYAATGRLPNTKYDFHNWDPDKREEYSYALSELHAEAFRRLPSHIQQELKKLFEFTTVTGKLRRIAEFNTSDATVAIRQSRPDSICLTFLNYWYPELWDKHWVDVISNPAVMATLAGLENDLDVPIQYVTTGAKSEHFINLEKAPEHVLKVAKEVIIKTVADKDKDKDNSMPEAS